MSDTPRTDAATHTEEGKEWLQEDACRLHELGKQLERELAAANALNAELLEALKMAYHRLVSMQYPERHTPECQMELCIMRDVIAAATGKSAEEVQNEAEGKQSSGK